MVAIFHVTVVRVSLPLRVISFVSSLFSCTSLIGTSFLPSAVNAFMIATFLTPSLPRDWSSSFESDIPEFSGGIWNDMAFAPLPLGRRLEAVFLSRLQRRASER